MRGFIGVLLALGAMLLAGCSSDTTVSSTPGFSTRNPLPSPNATGVATNPRIAVTFSMPVNAATVTTATFTLSSAAGAVAGTVAVDPTGGQATFTPGAALTANTRYTATVSSGIRSMSGISLASSSWAFTTGAAADTTAPSIIDIDPLDGSLGVSTSTRLTVLFSEPIDGFTFDASKVTLTGPSGPVVTRAAAFGSFGYVFPMSTLEASAVYTVTISNVVDLANNVLSPPFSSTFTTIGPFSDLTPPTVTATTPLDAATGVGLSSGVSASFSEPMLASTLTPATFTVSDGLTNVPGSVSYFSQTATFLPSIALSVATTYIATITTGATDLAGNPLAANHVWTFTTTATPDTTPPTVTLSFPNNGATGVSATVIPYAVFSELMDSATVNATTVTLTEGTIPVAGTVAYSGNLVEFIPTTALNLGATYTATITTGVTDLPGNAMAANHVWSFTIAGSADITPPTVSSTTPASNSVGLDPAAVSISVTFSEPVDTLTLVSPNIYVWNNSLNTEVTGTWNLVGNTATFTPTAPLTDNHVFAVVVTTGVLDLAGNPGPPDRQVFNFTTVGRTGKFAYSADSGALSISAYTISPTTGALTAAGGKTVAGAPTALAVDRSGSFLYAGVSGTNQISPFSINATTGSLTALASVALGVAPTGMAASPDKSFLCVVESTTGTLSSFPINPDGTLGAKTVQGTGMTNPRSVIVGPNGMFVYVADRALSNLHAYGVTGAGGALTLEGTHASGSGPVALATSPIGWFVYTANNAGNSVSIYFNDLWSYNTLGIYSLVYTGSAPTGASPTAIAIHPSGQYAYVANGADNTIWVYSRDTMTGGLTSLGLTAQVTTGSSPSAISIDPSGKFLYVTGKLSTNVMAFAINANGTLTWKATTATSLGPIAVATTAGP
ncbi:MAG: Ig-like domain-containing protein [Nitrospirota bacterium]|nr:Ig-like domain-containing protein [Nitrospirota bacterium]